MLGTITQCLARQCATPLLRTQLYFKASQFSKAIWNCEGSSFSSLSKRFISSQKEENENILKRINIPQSHSKSLKEKN